ncbi:hypothetical protein R3P38DRAFT_3074808 [Favolaschia claudopus]|uniref:C2 domain-containing protein n=1 Tax=Favolaschia claudopus TaxID=2862362 RepID=A0AAV9ZWW8_9AGAR
MSSLKLVVHKAETIKWHPGPFHSNKPPNLYVKVYHNKHRLLKTRALGRNADPIWNSSCDFIALASSEILTFRIFHCISYLGLNMHVAEATTSIQDLIEQSCSDQSVCLDINGSRGKFRLYVSLEALTVQQAVTQQTEDISKLAIPSTTEEILAPAETIERVSASGNLSVSFNVVLSALRNIVKVGDELAKVTSVYFKTLL